MKPWTARKQIESALRNTDVRIDGRRLPDGTVLRGLYATRGFAPGDAVAAYHGTIIRHESLGDLRQTDPTTFERVMEYGVKHRDGHLFQDDPNTVGGHLANHSCQPNAEFDGQERDAVIVRAVRPIAAGDEITVFYGWVGMKAAYDKSWHPCACAAPYCAGHIELHIEMLDHGDGTGGPCLEPEEVAKRFLADMINDTNVHESLLLAYGRESSTRVIGAKVLAELDPVVFTNKLRLGASTAVRLITHSKWPGPVSEHRRAQIIRTHRLGDPTEAS